MSDRKVIVAVLVALLAAILVVGCGGGGGGGSTGGGGGGGNTYAVEAYFTADPTAFVDPTNMMVSDQVTFVLASYDQNGVRSVVSGVTWSTNDTTAQAGTLDPSTGAYSALSPSAQTYKVTTSFGGTAYQASYAVTPLQARLYGKIVNITNAAGVPAIKALFFDGSGTQVGSVTSANDGTIRASVPTTAVSMNLDPNSIPLASFYRAFSYIGIRQGKTAGLSTGGNTATTLNDTAGNWVVNDLALHSVSIVSGTGAGQSLIIASNTSTQITVQSPWTVVPDTSSTYAFTLLRYSPTISGCNAKIPALANGTVSQLESNVYLVPITLTPPGPPTGCGF